MSGYINGPLPPESLVGALHDRETETFPCPRCGEEINDDEDWQRHHSLRGRAGRNWRRYVSRWFVR